MRSPAAIVAHVDARLQRRFDQFVHAVMRKTGASKRVMRRGGWSMAVIAMGVDLTMARHDAGSRLVGTICFGIYCAIRFGDDAEDKDAEASNMRSIADGHATWRKAAGLVMLACNLETVVPAAVVLGLVWLYQGYLCRTSPQVPPQKEREPKLVLMPCSEAA